MNQTVFIVLTQYNTNGSVEVDNVDIIGVFSSEEKAKNAMRKDIAKIKKEWSHIDFDDPEGWHLICDNETCYKGFTDGDDYSYSIYIKQEPIQ